MISKPYTLDELCIFIRNGKSVKQSKDVDGLPITRIETIANQTIDFNRVGYASLSEEGGKSHLLEYGDILFSHINSLEHLCKTAIYTGFPEKLVHGMNLLCFRPNPQLIFPQYLLHLLRSSRIRTSLLQFANKSVNQASISAGNLKSFKVKIPPLEEQRRIASILDQADELRRKRQQAIEKLDQLLQATFIDMFGDPVSNPKGWDLIKLSEVCSKITVGIVVKPASYYVESGVPAIRSLNIGINKIIKEKFVYFTEDDNNSILKKTKLLAGDVVTVRSGQPGKSAVIEQDMEGCNAIDVLITRTDNSKLLPEFLSFFLNSDAGKQLVMKEQRGQVQKHLNVSQLADAIIPLPPIDLQKNFFVNLGEIYGIIDKAFNAKNLTDNLFSSLQNQAFNGTL
ncbi:restriction endonuclease subunit S [Acinetobacter sp. AHP123]|uniref:restriction endonuclease subunit S n=1 Tax=Acinetobacter sp. AHP123 TaxID=2913495 RepID=UPI0020764D5F|nr:restriction endonuclease subunit S [Acinetobacter sp. AHP123]